MTAAAAPISTVLKQDVTIGLLEGPLANFAISVQAGLDVDDVSPSLPRSFAEGLPGVDSEALPLVPLTRTDILKHARGSSLDTPTLCAAIMSWGGMHRNNRDSLFKRSPKDWVTVSDDIRQGRLDRVQAYEGFRELRQAGKLKGMGPAFFTKLIYFLPPRDHIGHRQGCIMDQWAGCSINVLTGEDVVLMNSTATWKNTKEGHSKKYDFMVSDLNTGACYQAFCNHVDALATRFGITSDQIDRALMSDGGRKPLSWRKYVIGHRKP